MLLHLLSVSQLNEQISEQSAIADKTLHIHTSAQTKEKRTIYMKYKVEIFFVSLDELYSLCVVPSTEQGVETSFCKLSRSAC